MNDDEKLVPFLSLEDIMAPHTRRVIDERKAELDRMAADAFRSAAVEFEGTKSVIIGKNNMGIEPGTIVSEGEQIMLRNGKGYVEKIREKRARQFDRAERDRLVAEAKERTDALWEAASGTMLTPLRDLAMKTAEMYGIVADPTAPVDPLTLPLPPIAPNADREAKDRQVEWVLHNFTDGMLAKLYKMIYTTQKTKDGWRYRMDNVDEIIKKG